jgi:hypothetical protein
MELAARLTLHEFLLEVHFANVFAARSDGQRSLE